MTITAKVICDSVAHGARITTMQLRYPKFIHGEFMTHRMFSRNASSSRAIPAERLIDDILADPVYPSYWGKNQPGMQARAELDDAGQELAFGLWELALDEAVVSARNLIKLGVHKQIVNRILEPFSHINVVVTATDWTNFFMLRCHPDAQPEMRILAHTMFLARNNSAPVLMSEGDWHLPFILDSDRVLRIDDKIKLSVARCASVSYLTVEGEPMTLERAIALYDQLFTASPPHMSPFEHQAFARRERAALASPQYSGNFRGWMQYRKTIPGECAKD